MKVNMHTISMLLYIPICTSIEDIQMATHQDSNLQKAKTIYKTILATPKRQRGTEHEALLSD